MVAIVGNSTWECMQAKKALEVEWEQDSTAESTSYHEEELTALLEKPTETPARKDGDVNAAFAKAAKIVEST